MKLPIINGLSAVMIFAGLLSAALITADVNANEPKSKSTEQEQAQGSRQSHEQQEQQAERSRQHQEQQEQQAQGSQQEQDKGATRGIQPKGGRPAVNKTTR